MRWWRCWGASESQSASGCVSQRNPACVPIPSTDEAIHERAFTQDATRFEPPHRPRWALRAKRDRIDAAPPGRARVPGGDPRDDPRGRGVLAAACARRPPVGSAGNGGRADILRRMAGQRCTYRQMKNLGSDPIPAAAGLRLEPRVSPSRAAHRPTLSTTPYQSASRSPLPASPSAPADVTTSTSLRAGSTKTFCPRSPHSANWRSRPDDTIQIW